ncbi:MAG: M23 family metallopeptidase [Spirochaetes bacterium]|nr:M23 family metallopeptidase [Spirochaetota bacterium]
MSLKTSGYRSVLIFTIIIGVSVFWLSSMTAEEKPVRIYTEKLEDGGIDFYGDNTDLFPYRVKINLTELENMKPTKEAPFISILPPGSNKMYLLGLRRINNMRYSYRYRYNYYLGDSTTAKHDDSYEYLLPYEHGTKRQLGQAYHGLFSHFDRIAYALDFTMPIGTKVCAAREGLVVGVKEDSNIGGPGMYYHKYGNYITIYHDDGTFAKYVHLKQNGAIVKKGEKVKAGDVIGYSGNTGRSKGPHLHFEVSIPIEEGVLQTIPTKFLAHDKKAISLRSGYYYYSTHPDKPDYVVSLGRNIKESDYTNYKKEVSQTDSIKIRKEKIDTTYLFFIANGFTSDKEVTVKFTLNNMVASKNIPVTVRVPALTETYLLFLRAKDSDDPSNYNFSHTYKYNFTYKSAD